MHSKGLVRVLKNWLQESDGLVVRTPDGKSYRVKTISKEIGETPLVTGPLFGYESVIVLHAEELANA
jgi:hypothetical protein